MSLAATTHGEALRCLSSPAYGVFLTKAKPVERRCRRELLAVNREEFINKGWTLKSERNAIRHRYQEGLREALLYAELTA